MCTALEAQRASEALCGVREEVGHGGRELRQAVALEEVAPARAVVERAQAVDVGAREVVEAAVGRPALQAADVHKRRLEEGERLEEPPWLLRVGPAHALAEEAVGLLGHLGARERVRRDGQRLAGEDVRVREDERRPRADVARVEDVVLKLGRREGAHVVRARGPLALGRARRLLRQLCKVLHVRALAQARERHARVQEDLLNLPLGGVVDGRLDDVARRPLAQRHRAVDELPRRLVAERLPRGGHGAALIHLVGATVPGHGPRPRRRLVQRRAEVRRVGAAQRVG
mmetsp:Transcript_26034/g.92857  ORF Transcript_26034/g.92857 Transcript_26034/m.92857 type:complete len:286 (-) Transcript_26034:517-1374(-)